MLVRHHKYLYTAFRVTYAFSLFPLSLPPSLPPSLLKASCGSSHTNLNFFFNVPFCKKSEKFLLASFIPCHSVSSLFELHLPICDFRSLLQGKIWSFEIRLNLFVISFVISLTATVLHITCIPLTFMTFFLPIPCLVTSVVQKASLNKLIMRRQSLGSVYNIDSK